MSHKFLIHRKKLEWLGEKPSRLFSQTISRFNGKAVGRLTLRNEGKWKKRKKRKRERDAASREITRRTRIENRETSKRDLSLCRRFEWQTSKGCRPSVKRSNAPVKKALTYGAFSTGRGRSGRDRREKEKSFFQESEVTFRSAFENGDFLEMSMPRTREICLS